MLCDKCHSIKATSHISQTVVGGAEVQRHYCERCAEKLGLLETPGSHLLLFPWEEMGPGSFSAVGTITAVRDDCLVLKLIRSSHYPPGSELRICLGVVPQGLRRLGDEFGFNFPVERLSLVLLP